MSLIGYIHGAQEMILLRGDPETFAKFGFYNPQITSIGWPTMMEFYVDYHFVHYTGGSGERHEQKWQTLHLFMKSILE